MRRFVILCLILCIGGICLSGCAVTDAVLAPAVLAQQFYQAGKEMMFGVKKDYQGAANSFQKALELDPELTDAREGLLQAYANLGDPAKAAEVLAQLAGRSQGDAEIALSTADIANIKDKLRPDSLISEDTPKLTFTDPTVGTNMDILWIDMLEQDISRMPNNPMLHYMLGLYYYNTGRYSDALKCFQKVLKLVGPDTELARTTKSYVSRIKAMEN